MKIYVDLDMVLVPLLDVWLDLINTTEGTDYKIQDIKKYNCKILGDRLHYLKDGTVYDKLKPYENADRFLADLTKFGKVVILSNSIGKSNDNKKIEFCNKYFKGFDVICTDTPKHKIVRNNVLVDDNFENIYMTTKNGGIGILFNYNNLCRYNDYSYANFMFLAVSSYSQLLELFVVLDSYVGLS